MLCITIYIWHMAYCVNSSTDSRSCETQLITTVHEIAENMNAGKQMLSFIYYALVKSFLHCLILSPLSKHCNSLVILIIVIIVSREWPNSTRCLPQFKSHGIMPTYSLATYSLYQTETKKILKSQRPAEDSTLLPATQWAVLHCIAVMFLVFQHTLKVRNYRTG